MADEYEHTGWHPPDPRPEEMPSVAPPEVTVYHAGPMTVEPAAPDLTQSVYGNQAVMEEIDLRNYAAQCEARLVEGMPGNDEAEPFPEEEEPTIPLPSDPAPSKAFDDEGA